MNWGYVVVVVGAPVAVAIAVAAIGDEIVALGAVVVVGNNALGDDDEPEQYRVVAEVEVAKPAAAAENEVAVAVVSAHHMHPIQNR